MIDLSYKGSWERGYLEFLVFIVEDGKRKKEVRNDN